jgi:hypothetical protein
VNTPKGWFRCKNLRGKITLAFSCGHCRITILRGITDPRGIFHCGKFEKPPQNQDRLPLFNIPRPAAQGLVGDFGNAAGVLIGW